MFRLWSAIATISAILEQRVFILTSRQLFPNIYTMLVGPPGTGKSIAGGAVRKLCRKVKGLHLSPTSMTGASLVDALYDAKRVIDPLEYGEKPLLFNSLFLIHDDLQVLVRKMDSGELIANLTKFYDVDPYIRTRHTEKLTIDIESPQLTMLMGTTNSHLQSLDSGIWDQGFMSRTIIAHSSTGVKKEDVFAHSTDDDAADLEHDLQRIFELRGQFSYTEGFKAEINQWNEQNCPPKPTHPRMKHYIPRRIAHILKLSMISSADRNDSLNLDVIDFNRAKKWLLEAESSAQEAFSGAQSSDAKIMQEILHEIGTREIMEEKLKRMVSDKVNALAVKRMLDIMVETRMIVSVKVIKGQRIFKVNPAE